MYTVYILYSKKIEKYYIGSTKDIHQRVIHHNAGLSRWTKQGIPWILVYTETYVTRGEAVKREAKIKSYKGGNEFRKLLYR